MATQIQDVLNHTSAQVVQAEAGELELLNEVEEPNDLQGEATSEQVAHGKISDPLDKRSL